jgi:lipopolysaccharide/colanic/teichoic acid biosynthesis glycosyltransferase/glycosyltransferase involved in cell wall biosynthesis
MLVVHVATVPEALGFLKGQVGFMRANGVEIAAVAAPGKYLDDFGREQGVGVHAVAMARRITPAEDARALMSMTRTLHRLRPTIVHAHTPKGGLLGTVGALAAGVPVRIYHMRGLPLETARGSRRQLLWATERVTCAAATHVLCVSHSLRQRAIDEGLCPPEKIEVLGGGSGQGVDASRFDPAQVGADARRATRARLGIPDEALVVGFLGRLSREKGLGELLQAFSALSGRHPRLHLMVAGGEEPRDAISETAMRFLREDARVHWLGHDWESPPLYAAMDVVALPTYREGFPNVPLEAAAMGLPVVATSVTGCVDAVVDGTTGTLVLPRDAAALEVALERYLEQPALRRAHGEAGRQRVLASFRREPLWDALLSRYLQLVGRGPGPAYHVTKRAMDLAGAGTVLLVSALPMLAISAAIAVKMGTPVVFAQERPGKDERHFKLYKFRTMTDARGSDGEPLPDGERLTPLGRWLRKTSLDELPELYNVLRGEMSLVGPRPLLTRYLPWFTERERLRHTVPPGVTGWAQLQGRNQVSWDERIGHDVWYVENRSLLRDLEILLATVGLVLRGDGVVVDARSTMLNFDEERQLRRDAATSRQETRGDS